MISFLLLFALAAQDPAADSARARFKAFVDAQHVPGASIAVAKGGRILWSDVAGSANLEHRVAVTPKTKFRVGSISKALTSAALAKLWEQGKVDLDAPVQRYAPTFPDKGAPITSRQLAGHLSGIPHYTAADIVNRTRYPNVTAALDKFKDRPLLFTPGQKYSYSSYGWNLLSVVVENASGESFLSYMRTSVFEQLGMANTVPDEYDVIVPDRTAFYQVRPDGSPFNGPAVDNSDVYAGGGFLSTAEDIARFPHGVATGNFVAAKTRELMFTPMRTTDGKETTYGLGWQVGEWEGHRTVGHGGSHVGATAEMIYVPDLDLSVAILTNSNNRGIRDLARAVMGFFR